MMTSLQVDGRRAGVHYNAPDGSFKLRQLGMTWVRLSTPWGLKVDWDGVKVLWIYIPSTFQTFVEGLCQDYNGDVSNDWTMSDGTDASNNTEPHNDVGISWFVDNPEEPE